MNKHQRQDCLADRSRAVQTPEAGDSARVCMDCGTTIPAERLKAMPQATRCVECQTDIERMSAWDWGMAE